MLIPLLLGLAAMAPDSGSVYNGRLGQIAVLPPRLEADLTVDGAFNEPVWQRAIHLTGFSEFSPVDGAAAEDSTDVMVWYSATAMHFGIRAWEPHGEVHSTLADRDHIFADDNIQILLGTYNDGRQAYLFAVNPLGIQGDGALVETGNRGSGFGGQVARESPDLSPDYVFESKGRLTEFGYQIEVSVPFKSLRYQSADEQIWQLNLVREVQHSGFEDSWTPARRANASFLGQSGTLSGLRGLRRGVVLDVTPEVTARYDGGQGKRGWDYDRVGPDLGGTIRWGISNNLTLNGTAKPDFSQVETDAGQLAFDPRQALFFPEKRPFFLDGIELFNTPNQLIYTRSIVQPAAAAKLTGKAVGTDVGYLFAVDDQGASSSGRDNPVFNIVRVQRDLGHQSRLGVVFTDREEGGEYNRVAGVDGRLVLARVYAAQFQLAGSRTSTDPTTTTAPLWQARFDRNGRAFGFRTFFAGISDRFDAQSGFLTRAGVVRMFVDPSYTVYGKPGALFENFSGDIALDGTWRYQDFVHGRRIQDQKLHFNANASVRGGWGLSGGLFIESFGYDPGIYSDYFIETKSATGLDTIPYTGTPTLPNFEGFINVNTPQFARFDAFVFALYGRDENFFEWSSSKLLILQTQLNWRPTDKLRLALSYNAQWVQRLSDGSTVDLGQIPRLKLEYQIARPIYLRLVGQYSAERTDSLRDDGRTNGPVLIRTATGFERTQARQQNLLRGDVLFSYQPTPGTVFFLGYGSTMEEDQAFRFRGLARQTDGFFLKGSYLFRVGQ